MPVEFVHVPEDLAISSEAAPQVQVWVRGRLRVVRSLDPRDLHATVDLGGIQRLPSERTFEIGPSEIKAPQGNEIVQVVPSQLHLSFDRRVARPVAVRPRIVGSPAVGWQIATVVADPPTVTVAGPEARVRAVEAALTDPVDVTGVSGRAAFTVNAYVTDPLVRITRSNQVRVTVVAQRSSQESR